MTSSLPPPLPWRVRTRPERLMLLLLASSALVGSVLLAAHAVLFALFGCVWKCTTGLPCAGCGGTRALGSLLLGSPLEALAWNPGAVLAAVLAFAAGLYAATILLFRLEPWRPACVGSVRWKFVILAAIGVNWLYLICAGRV